MIEIAVKTPRHYAIHFHGFRFCGSSALTISKENLPLGLWSWNSQHRLSRTALFSLPHTGFQQQEFGVMGGAHLGLLSCVGHECLAGKAVKSHITANKTCHPSVI